VLENSVQNSGSFVRVYVNKKPKLCMYAYCVYNKYITVVFCSWPNEAGESGRMADTEGNLVAARSTIPPSSPLSFGLSVFLNYPCTPSQQFPRISDTTLYIVSFSLCSYTISNYDRSFCTKHRYRPFRHWRLFFRLYAVSFSWGRILFPVPA
jgi:hypothetical protein